MIIKQFVAEGLGNASHMVISPGAGVAGVAAVIDPWRDVDIYLDAAAEMGVRITHVLETHVHADFISGARELAARTGAVIGAGAGASLQYDFLPLREGNQVRVGDVVFTVLETPGHTPEHISFVAQDLPEPSAPSALFSGGALLVGSAARTDLLGQEMAEPLARKLYHSLHHKLMRLDNDVMVYPTHGAGSFCASGMGRQRVTTIGQERQHNSLLQLTSEDEFVAEMRRRQTTYPAYYRHMRAINQKGPRLLNGLPTLTPLPPQQVWELMADGTVATIDTRPPEAFDAGHIPGAYGIAFDPAFGVWVGAVVPFGKPLVLVTDGDEIHQELVRQLVRVGYEELRGYLEGGMAAWRAAESPVVATPTLSVAELRQKGNGLLVLDVRQEDEWAAGHIPGAVHIPLGALPGRVGELPRGRPVAVHCAHGYRGAIAASILQREGLGHVYHVLRGFTAWREAGFAVAH